MLQAPASHRINPPAFRFNQTSHAQRQPKFAAEKSDTFVKTTHFGSLPLHKRDTLPVERATINDFPEISAFLARNFEQNPNQQEYAARLFQETIKQGGCLVIRNSEGKIVATAFLGVRQDDLEKSGSVFSVATDPAYRKQGLSKSLMKSLISQAREQNLSYLLLRAENPVAIKFYRKLGFDLDSARLELDQPGIQLALQKATPSDIPITKPTKADLPEFKAFLETVKGKAVANLYFNPNDTTLLNHISIDQFLIVRDSKQRIVAAAELTSHGRIFLYAAPTAVQQGLENPLISALLKEAHARQYPKVNLGTENFDAFEQYEQLGFKPSNPLLMSMDLSK